MVLLLFHVQVAFPSEFKVAINPILMLYAQTKF